MVVDGDEITPHLDSLSPALRIFLRFTPLSSNTLFASLNSTLCQLIGIHPLYLSQFESRVHWPISLYQVGGLDFCTARAIVGRRTS